MSTLLWELYSGRVYPAEDMKPSDSRKYREASNKYTKELETLKQKLSPECIALLESVQGHEADVTDAEIFCGFKEGFSLGLVMMYEALNKN